MSYKRKISNEGAVALCIVSYSELLGCYSLANLANPITPKLKIQDEPLYLYNLCAGTVRTCMMCSLIGRAGASPPSRTTGLRCLYICMYIYIRYVYQIPLISKCLYVNLF